jgi:hypothetical protein
VRSPANRSAAALFAIMVDTGWQILEDAGVSAHQQHVGDVPAFQAKAIIVADVIETTRSTGARHPDVTFYLAESNGTPVGTTCLSNPAEPHVRLSSDGLYRGRRRSV